MANMRSVCFIIAFHKFVTLENRLTYQCPSSWPVVITMKKKSAGTRKKSILGYWPVQLNDNKFATGQILKKPVEVVKGRILASWAQKSPEPCIVVVVMEVVTYRPALFLRPHMIDWYMYTLWGFDPQLLWLLTTWRCVMMPPMLAIGKRTPCGVTLLLWQRPDR